MGQKVAVVTDSLACLTKELAEQYNIRIVPLSFLLQGKVYRDWVDITPSKAYELFLQNPDSFESSAPSPMDFLEAFREVGTRAPNIFCVTLSAKLSNTYNVALMAKEQVKAELPTTSIAVCDSRTTTAAEGFIALAAGRAAAKGKDLAEVIKAAEDVRDKVVFLAFLDTIRHVYRSGRIPKVASQVGSLLQVKPILSVTPDSGGAVHFVGIERSRPNGIRRLIKMMRDNVSQHPVHVAIMHAYALEEAKKLQEMIAAEFNCVELWLTEFSPLMGYAVGTGTVGVAFYKES